MKPNVLACSDYPDDLDRIEQSPAVPVSIAAVLLGVSRMQVYRLLDSGQLKPVLLFGSRFVSVLSVRERLASRSVR